LTGNIAALVNGARTGDEHDDIIKYHGGDPANFLDGAAAPTRPGDGGVPHPAVRSAREAVLVNILGIMKCDTIADGITARTRKSASTCRWSCV